MPRKSDQPKKNSWAESQFKKAKVNGSPETWEKAAEALAPPPTDEQQVRSLLFGEDYRKCPVCGKLKRRIESEHLVCPNDRCREYGKRYGKT